MNRKVGQTVSYNEQFTNRVVLIRIDTKPTPTTIVQAHMATSRAEDEEVEKVYENTERVIQSVKGDENLIITGKWNTVVRKGLEERVVGEYELGIRKERGERLTE